MKRKDFITILELIFATLPAIFVPLYLLIPTISKCEFLKLLSPYTFNVFVFGISIIIICFIEQWQLSHDIKNMYIWLTILLNSIESLQVAVGKYSSNVIILMLMVFMTWSLIKVILIIANLTFKQFIFMMLLSAFFILSPNALLPVLVSFLFSPLLTLFAQLLFLRKSILCSIFLINKMPFLTLPLVV
ncbi:hypothetical protein [Limosilactobacillus oris]|uniref:hypothetical protein n=1 Tax=Limosilactobacillus oris TaxID=1632 RepID=UPI0024B92EAB|nr:hypothetical protein [Limosilactobacillus oris]